MTFQTPQLLKTHASLSHRLDALSNQHIGLTTAVFKAVHLNTRRKARQGVEELAEYIDTHTHTHRQTKRQTGGQADTEIQMFQPCKHNGG